MSLSLAVECKMGLGCEHTKMNGVCIILLKYTIADSFLDAVCTILTVRTTKRKRGGRVAKGFGIISKTDEIHID